MNRFLSDAELKAAHEAKSEKLFEDIARGDIEAVQKTAREVHLIHAARVRMAARSKS